MKKNNILFLFPDQHRGDWLPFDAAESQRCNISNQPPLRMNNLRQLMEHGTTFTRAVTNSPLCVPARACLAAGMGYQKSGVYNNDFCYPINRKTFYSVIREQGYNVGGVGKFDIHKPVFYWNSDGWIDQLSQLGFTHGIDSEGKYDLLWSISEEPHGPYAKYLHENGLLHAHAKDYIRRFRYVNDTAPTPLPEDAYCDNWVTANALHLLTEMRKEDKPWFLQVNFPGPHNPWDVTPAMKERWKDVVFPLPEDYDGDKDELMEVRRNYAAMLENIDRNIGILLEDLRQAGELENTLIVYSSDHGEMLGDRGLYFKCLPWKASLNIPIVISGPGVRQGELSEELAQLNDLAATFADFSGGALPPDRDARSLLPTARGETDHLRTYQLAGLDNAVHHEGTYPGYENLNQYTKSGKGNPYLDKLFQEVPSPTTKNSVKKYDFKGSWECVTTKTHKLVKYSDGRTELYDLVQDPFEHHNICTENSELVQTLSNHLTML